MSDSAHLQHKNEETTSWQPGAKLKSLREQAGLSLDTIATATRIPLAKLRALEEDAYDLMGTETFAIAYFRKYSKYLGVDSDPFVEQFKRLTGSTTPASWGPGPDTAANAVDVESKSSLIAGFRAWHVVVAVVVAWLLAVVVLKQDRNESEVSGVPQQASEQPVISNPKNTVEPAAVTNSTRTEAVTPAGLPQEHRAANVVGDVQTAVTEAAEEETFDDSMESLDTRNEQIIVSGTTASGADVLLMSFSDECWVKVWDAKGEVIFAHLQNSGDNLRLSGEAPFSVMLGNARAVDLLVNDRPVSTEPQAGRRTLRLNVGP